jgi:putative hydrolase of the HAD superfamily
VSDIRAVFWDFGGVILASPFDAFAAYEREHGLPPDFIRSVNTVDPDTNAWARIERRELTPEEFDVAFAEESARLGHRVPGGDVLDLLHGEVRPQMVAALDRVIDAGYVTACLTNNVSSDVRDDVVPIMARFHHVVESSKVGSRKPEPAFYERGCELAGVEPDEVVYLDDLGINLKPARAMGMTTIKVADPDDAIDELADVLGIGLR